MLFGFLICGSSGALIGLFLAFAFKFDPIVCTVACSAVGVLFFFILAKKQTPKQGA